VDLVPGGSRDAIPGGDEDLVPPPVSLEGNRGCVGLSAIRFDHEPVLGPEEVDGQSIVTESQGLVAVGSRQTPGQEAGEDEGLEIAADIRHRIVLGAPFIGDATQGIDASPASRAVESHVQRAQVETSDYCGALDRPPQRVGSEDARQVDERAGRARNGDTQV
jgi:hypothetical protein